METNANASYLTRDNSIQPKTESCIWNHKFASRDHKHCNSPLISTTNYGERIEFKLKKDEYGLYKPITSKGA